MNAPRVTQEQRDFAVKLVAVKAEAGQLGLWKTLQALEAAVTEVGWELAEKLGDKPRKKKQS